MSEVSTPEVVGARCSFWTMHPFRLASAGTLSYHYHHPVMLQAMEEQHISAETCQRRLSAKRLCAPVSVCVASMPSSLGCYEQTGMSSITDITKCHCGLV